MKLTVHLYLVPWLRINEPVLLLFIRPHVVDRKNIIIIIIIIIIIGICKIYIFSFLQKNFTSIFISNFDILIQFPVLQ